jgi:sugar lactone lactonase YvrE
MEVEIFAHQQDILGEGPLWNDSEQALYWIDIGQRLLHRQTITGQRASWELPGRPGCVERLVGGNLLLTFGAGVHRFETRGGRAELLYPVPLPPGNRFNEGKADPSGRLWFGSMQDNFGPRGEPIPIERAEGTLFRLDAEHSLAVIEQGIGISNTLAWSPDETRLYFADSQRDRIFMYDYDAFSGNVSNRRLFFEGPGQGLPDGSAMDIDGCLWNARWGAGSLLRISPDGRLDRQIAIPALQPSSCAFGGPNLNTLFITSARNGMTAAQLAQSPLSGSVFAIAGVAQGMPVPPVRWNEP